MIIWSSLKLCLHIRGYLFIFANTEIYVKNYTTDRKIVKTTFDKFFRCMAHLGLKTVQYHYKFLITEEAFLKVSFLM